jgi:rhodanese-related sulfurtransferase
VKKFIGFSSILLFLFVALVLGPFCWASDDEIPRVIVEELKKMVDGKADIVILDVQPQTVYAKGHIKGAISFPWARKIDEARVANLPRTKTIIAYCDCGPGEADSASVAAQLMNLGFADVKVLKDPSVRGWKGAGYPME